MSLIKWEINKFTFTLALLNHAPNKTRKNWALTVSFGWPGLISHFKNKFWSHVWMFFWKLLLMHIFTALFIVVLVSFLTLKKKVEKTEIDFLFENTFIIFCWSTENYKTQWCHVWPEKADLLLKCIKIHSFASKNDWWMYQVKTRYPASVLSRLEENLL